MFFHKSYFRRFLITVFAMMFLSGCVSSTQKLSPEYILHKNYSQQQLFDIAINYDDDSADFAFYKLLKKELIEEAALKAKRLKIRKQAILDIDDLNTLARLEGVSTDDSFKKYIEKRRYELVNNLVELKYHIPNNLKDSSVNIVVNGEVKDFKYINSHPDHTLRIMVLPGVQNIAIVNLTGKLAISEFKTDDKSTAMMSGKRTYTETTTIVYYPINTAGDTASISWVAKPDKYYVLYMVPDNKNIELSIKEYAKGANTYRHRQKIIKDNGVVITKATYSLVR